MTRLVGPRGLSVLIFIGLVAPALAVVGWYQRGNGEVGPLPNYSSAGISGVLGLAVCLTGCKNQRG